MVSRTAILAMAASFWSSAGGRHAFGTPVDLERAAIGILPLAVHRVSKLSTATVSEILARFGHTGFEIGTPRNLRGCLVADLGVGLVLVEANDPIDEQRLTLAHEVAHFLLHYLTPRNRAIAAFGPRIVPMLERTRSPTRAELFSSALRAVPITPFRHAMERNGTRPVGNVAAMETEADELALELLAPHDVVHLSAVNANAIALRFGIPLDAAMRLIANDSRVVTTIGVEGLFGIR